MKPNESEIQSILQQISDVLLINGGLLTNPGLYNGDMGLVLFFAHYVRYTHIDLYSDYCYDLINKLQSKINWETPLNYETGLSGIGSAIEYLIQKGFFETNSDEILEDFDTRIFFTINSPYLQISEVIDIGHYTMWRLSGNSSKKDMIRQNIIPLIEKILREQSDIKLNHPFGRRKTPHYLVEKTSDHCLDQIAKNCFWNQELGLQNGLAGWGLSLLTELDGNDSWISLLHEKN